MDTCQDKNQKLFVSSFCKIKHKKRNIKGVSCLCGAAFIVNPNLLCSSHRNLRIVSKGQVLKSRLSKDLLEKNVQRFNCILCFYFKRKCWEVNVAMEVVADTEGCFFKHESHWGVSCHVSAGPETSIYIFQLLLKGRSSFPYGMHFTGRIYILGDVWREEKKNALKKKDLGWKMRRGSIHLNSKPGDGLRTSLMSRNKAILHIACCVIVGLVFTFV